LAKFGDPKLAPSKIINPTAKKHKTFNKIGFGFNNSFGRQQRLPPLFPPAFITPNTTPKDRIIERIFSLYN
jgi:hypothetical protein